MLDEGHKQHLNSMLWHAYTMVGNGDLEVEWYYKCIVIAAHEFAFGGEIDGALDLLGRVHESYYEEGIHAHMDSDEAFAKQVYKLSKHLVDQCVVHVGFSKEESDKAVRA